jgi:spore maturation protein CgeB
VPLNTSTGERGTDYTQRWIAEKECSLLKVVAVSLANSKRANLPFIEREIDLYLSAPSVEPSCERILSQSRVAGCVMKLVVFGLAISSSWGNGHATLLRGLFRAMSRQGHQIVFFERDVPYYAATRDLTTFEPVRLHIYPEWNEVARLAREELQGADVAMVTSYCFDGIAATELLVESGVPLGVFYDLDTPVTLARLGQGETVSYIGARGLADFDLVLSYTGGAALNELQQTLHARQVAPLYGSVDPEIHRRVEQRPHYRADLSYIGTYSADRQKVLEELFVASAHELGDRRFVMAGASYPDAFPWSSNIFFVRHLPPQEHPAFYSSSRLTLNVTRAPMARMGYCPSGRLFEAAACGTPILSDDWDGMGNFFTPGEEILIAGSTANAIEAIESSDAELQRISAAAYNRVMTCHTADHRARELERILGGAFSGKSNSQSSEKQPGLMEL